MTLTDASRINRILSERGILESAVANGWQAQPHGWRYPVFDLEGGVIGYRVKQLDRDPKYLWSPAKPKHALAEWYILPETSRAIAASDGLCYLANGEPALHAYHSAGVHNAIATTLAEIAVPANIQDVFQQLGITRLVAIVDNDYAGYQSAIKWRDALRGSGIDYEACTWGKVQVDLTNEDGLTYIGCTDVESKADGNDIWKLVAFDNTAFQTWITGVIALPLPVPQEKPQQEAKTFEETPQGLIDAIVSSAIARGLKERKGKGWLHGKSIFRDEKKASFGINMEHGYGKDLANGEIYSTFQVAERLNIDWQAYYANYSEEYLEAARRASQERIAAFVDDLERREHQQQENAIKDELSNQVKSWLDGDYRSWWKSNVPPKGILSALLNLTKTRSETARILCLLHDAFLTGRIIWACFTEGDLTAALPEENPKTIKTALNELLELSFIRFLSGGYLKEILHSEIAENSVFSAPEIGRKPKWYALNFDLLDIANHIYERLETAFLEKIHRRTYAKRSGKVAQGLGIESVQDLRPLQRRSQIVMQSDPYSKAAEQKYQLEMEGDGTFWYGWRAELASDTVFPIDIYNCESVQNLRAQLLLYWIEHIRAENTREDLRRLIGGSDGTLQTLYDEYGIVSEQQFERVDIRADFDDLRPVLREKQQQYRGMARKIAFKKWKEKGWQVQELERACINYARHSQEIARVFMLICKPSKQRLMTEDEMTALADSAIEAGQLDPVTEPTVKPEPKVVTSPMPRNPKRKFSQFQARLDVFMFTPYKLLSNVVLDNQQNVIYKAPSDVELMRWLADNTQVRLHDKKTGEQKIVLLRNVASVPDGYELRPYRMSCEIHGRPYVDTDGEIMRLLNGRREKAQEKLEEEASKPIILQQKAMVETPMRELSEFDRRTLDFIQRRYEREYAGKQESRFGFVRDSQQEREAA